MRPGQTPPPEREAIAARMSAAIEGLINAELVRVFGPRAADVARDLERVEYFPPDPFLYMARFDLKGLGDPEKPMFWVWARVEAGQRQIKINLTKEKPQ
jgi:hypothetical protein